MRQLRISAIVEHDPAAGRMRGRHEFSPADLPAPFVGPGVVSEVITASWPPADDHRRLRTAVGAARSRAFAAAVGHRRIQGVEGP